MEKVRDVTAAAFDTLPVVEVRQPGGQGWAIYADGRYTGFPDGAYIINRVPVLIGLRLVEQRADKPGACGE